MITITTASKIITGIIVAGSLAAAAGTSAMAASTNGNRGEHMDSLVSAIATKFNLNKSDVQQVVDEQRTQMQADRQAEQKTRLDQAVKDGKLTQAQEDLLLAKRAEEQTFRDSLKSMTEDERDAAMKQHRTEMEAWAKDNNIPSNYMMGMGGERQGRHGR